MAVRSGQRYDDVVGATDYETLAKVREAWPSFLSSLRQEPESIPGGRVTYTYVGQDGVPACDPVAMHDGIVTVVARHQYDESQIENELKRVTADHRQSVLGEAVVGFRVLGRDRAPQVLGEELALLGLQVQRLTKLVTGKG